MKLRRLITLACFCLGFAFLAAAQYTPNQLPYNYGNNKLGMCYNTTLNNWVPVANTSSNYTAYPVQCDEQGNLQGGSGQYLPLSGGTLATNAAIAFQGTGAATTLANLKGVTAQTGTTTADLVSYSGTTGQIQDSGVPSASVTTASSPIVGQTACIKAAGPPIVIGTCSTVVGSGGACTCN